MFEIYLSFTEGGATIAVPSDSAVEDYETFTITIASPPSGFTLGTNSTASVQIVNVSLVAGDWRFAPNGLDAGDRFRLMFKTETERDATSDSLGDYDTFVRQEVTAGHADIQPYASTFRVVGSTDSASAAWHTATGIMVSGEASHTPWSTPIYWLAGARVADDHNDSGTALGTTMPSRCPSSATPKA